MISSLSPHFHSIPQLKNQSSNQISTMNVKEKPKKTHRNSPSFSSTLLDEICRSIDGNGGGPQDFPAYGGTPATGYRTKTSSRRDEEIARFSRACLVDKRMEKGGNKKGAARKLENSVYPDNDLLLFSSTSTSADSSGALSSSDADFFNSSMESCYIKKPKPVRTPRACSEDFMFDDYQNYEKNRLEDDLIKSKSRAFNIYANLKKLRQPISPGAKLTSLINSFFTSMSWKKSRNTGRYQSKSSERMRNGIEGTVGFDLVGVVVDQDSKVCGERSVHGINRKCGKFGRPPLPPNALKVEDEKKCDLSMFRKIQNEDEDEDEDDGFSESSSDLFELDHLSLYGKHDRFCEELPVYETTYFAKNRGLIR